MNFTLLRRRWNYRTNPRVAGKRNVSPSGNRWNFSDGATCCRSSALCLGLTGLKFSTVPWVKHGSSSTMLWEYRNRKATQRWTSIKINVRVKPVIIRKIFFYLFFLLQMLNTATSVKCTPHFSDFHTQNTTFVSLCVGLWYKIPIKWIKMWRGDSSRGVNTFTRRRYDIQHAASSASVNDERRDVAVALLACVRACGLLVDTRAI